MSSYDYRSTVVRCRTISYDIVRYRTMSYDVVRCRTISQKWSMCHKPIVSGVTAQLRLQYRIRIGENFINLRCHLSHDVAARCDQGLSNVYDLQPIFMPPKLPFGVVYGKGTELYRTLTYLWASYHHASSLSPRLVDSFITSMLFDYMRNEELHVARARYKSNEWRFFAELK